MPTADVDGLTIAYELIEASGREPGTPASSERGPSGPARRAESGRVEASGREPGTPGRSWVVTPGGRFGKDYPGIRELATALAALGNRVLIWDRPNTGESDVCFAGDSEAALQAGALAGLLRRLDLGPAVLAGGSSGTRVSLLVAAAHRGLVAGVAMWWPSGGPYELLNVAMIFCSGSIVAAWNGGMEAVVALPEWREVLERNPSNRQRFLDQDPRAFIDTLERWMLACCPCEGARFPGFTDAELRAIDVPALVFQNGVSDPNHPRATSEGLAALLPNARLVDPPWPDTEWLDRQAARAATGEGIFTRWPQLAPMLHDWAAAIS